MYENEANILWSQPQSGTENGMESWTLNQKAENKLEAFENIPHDIRNFMGRKNNECRDA